MKRILSLFMALTMCFMLCGCGDKNTDHEYILSLLENGEYDMAISVIEHMKARETGVVPTEAPALSEELPAPADAPVSVSSTAELVADTVKAFMADRGNDMAKGYEDITAGKAEPVQVTHAMEYRLGNADGQGNAAHFLMINLSGSFAFSDGLSDNLQLVLDMDSSRLLNSADIDWDFISSFNGTFADIEEFQKVAINAYHSYLMYGESILWADAEIIEALSDTELAAANEKLEVK